MDLHSEFKTIKMISTKTYEIALVEMVNGQYCVAYEQNEKFIVSELVKDYHTADYMFESKLQDLEGN